MPLATLTHLPHVRQSSKMALPRPIQWKQPTKMKRLTFLEAQEMGGLQKEEPFPIAARATTMCADEKEAASMKYLGRLIKDIRFSSFAAQGTEPRSHSKHGSPQDSYHTQAKTL